MVPSTLRNFPTFHSEQRRGRMFPSHGHSCPRAQVSCVTLRCANISDFPWKPGECVSLHFYLKYDDHRSPQFPSARLTTSNHVPSSVRQHPNISSQRWRQNSWSILETHRSGSCQQQQLFQNMEQDSLRSWIQHLIPRGCKIRNFSAILSLFTSELLMLLQLKGEKEGEV